LTIPEKVRAAIDRRLGLLSEETRRVLAGAAVLGRNFDLSLVAAITGVSPEELAAPLAEAAATGILSNLPGALGRASFSHALFRESLYKGMSQPQRGTLHGRAGEALEKLHAADPDPHLAELAHHFSQAPEAASAKALDYATRAGDRAMSLLAYEEAIEHYGRALETSRRGDDQRLECELLLRSGDARWRAGDHEGAREVFLRAAALARGLRSAEMLARSALGCGAGARVYAFNYEPQRPLIDLLEEASRGLGSDSTLRVRVLARLALELIWTNESERRDAVAREAVEVAERLGDPQARLVAIYSRCEAVWGPDTIEEALASADEILSLAGELGDHEMTYLGHEIRVRALLQLGDPIRGDIDEKRCAELAEELRIAEYRRRLHHRSGFRALFDGRLEEARLAAQSPTTLLFVGWVEGRFEEIMAGRSMVEKFPLIPGWRAALAANCCDLDRGAEARADFEQLAAPGFSWIPRNDVWHFTMYYLARTCAYLRDTERAKLLSDLLRPYAHQIAVLSGANSMGSVSSSLGMLAATMGHWQDATEYFERAIERNRAIRNRPFTAIALCDYAAALLDRAAAGDGTKALVLLDEALAMMRAMGMHGRVAKGEALRLRAEGLTETSEAHVELVKRDRYWALSSGGKTHRLKDMKGLGYLVQLLRHPYREIAALDLVSGHVSEVDGVPNLRRRDLAEHGLRVSSLDGREDLVDPEAKAAYRRRLVELREELEDGLRCNDSARAARAQHEIDALTRELAAVVGLRGRTRQTASSAERARVNVTKSIRTAIDRIAEARPDLGAHLSSAVRTGAFSSYIPDPGSTISWQL
jgi:eukaryotic-like serine/threonine-protein kinase